MTPKPEIQTPPLAPANRNDRTTSRRKRLWLLGCAGVAFLMILMACLFVWRSFAHDITSLPKGEQYKSTRFEFRYGKATRVVDDPENHMGVTLGMDDCLLFIVHVVNGHELCC